MLAGVLLAAQLAVVGINAAFSDLPWTGEQFINGSVTEKTVTLSVYFALGVAAVVCAVLSFIKGNAKTEKTSAKQQMSKLAVCAMLLALYVVIQSVAVDITASLRISFNFLIYGVVGMLFGPSTGAVFGIAADILGFMVHPGVGGFFPAYTVINAIKGAIYGWGLYRGSVSSDTKPPSLACVAVVKTVDSLFCNLLLITATNSFFYGAGFLAILPGRFVKNILMLPIEIMMLYAVLRIFCETSKKAKIKL